MKLSPDLRKSIRLQLGDEAGAELIAFLEGLAKDVDTVKRTKVDVTPIVHGRIGSVTSEPLPLKIHTDDESS